MLVYWYWTCMNLNKLMFAHVYSHIVIKVFEFSDSVTVFLLELTITYVHRHTHTHTRMHTRLNEDSTLCIYCICYIVLHTFWKESLIVYQNS